VNSKATVVEQHPHDRAPSQRKVCILSLSDIPNDPRVRRQGDALYKAGWSVMGVGLPGPREQCPPWAILSRTQATKTGSNKVEERLEQYLAIRWSRKQAARIFHFLASLKVRMRPEHAVSAYWAWYWPWPHVRELYELAASITADVWLANDWVTLPVAARLAKEKGGIYVYDSHELATEEYSERLRWRLVRRPFVRVIEDHFIRGAKLVSCVSCGIATRLRELYQLQQTPLVIRNMPAYSAANFRPTGKNVRVLYHGIIAPQRGLEEAIDSFPDWRSDFSLTIRGIGAARYIGSIQDRIDRLDLRSRVEILPPVPMTELVRAAMSFDVGIFALPGHSLHNSFALPNKLFEYMMAGLALCISDLPEMRNIVETYKVGTLIERVSRDAIATAINSMDREGIDVFKRNSLNAALELNWENESWKMINAYDLLINQSEMKGI
jgi:glycosyltransferase involved in cell wall biosynthesis